MGNACHKDSFDSHCRYFHRIPVAVDCPEHSPMPGFPLGEGNNMPPGCILYASPARNNNACTRLACPPHISGYPSPGSGCLPILPASHSPLCFISSIRLSSCAPARMQEYSVTAANIPAAAMIPFILLHPFPYGELAFTDSYEYVPAQDLRQQFPIYGSMKKTLTGSSRKRPHA